MVKIAIYGKGGIGKSTTISNLAAVLAVRGYRVMQIGCDPKADSTMLLRHREPMRTVLSLVQEKKNSLTLDEMVRKGYGNVLCVEAGGPFPGTGCAGRGIIAALETLQQKGAYEVYQPDVVLYDVLGDVVCGGFSMPMRSGYADLVYVVTSGENMSIYAAANIATALDHFKNRGYARLGGFILNHRNVKREKEKVLEMAEEFHSGIVGELSRSELVQQAEEEGCTVIERWPDSQMAKEYEALADAIIEDMIQISK